MSKGLHKSKIDYIADAAERINRPGYVLNIVTGCKHSCPYCYARRMVLHGRLKGHKSYPHGFEPTFHPERIRAIGGKPKLIFLNDMGDVGGSWPWQTSNGLTLLPGEMTTQIQDFAALNRQHILLLLTKNPVWYRRTKWLDNIWCGFSATNNKELFRRWDVMDTNALKRCWISCEPWLDDKPPEYYPKNAWLVIGGLSGPNAKSVSDATLEWLMDDSVQAKRFTKRNALFKSEYWEQGLDDVRIEDCPREYPDEWKVQLEPITIDKAVQFGRPCIAGTGIPTEIVYERYLAGETTAELARDYGLTIEQIQSAISYEEEQD